MKSVEIPISIERIDSAAFGYYYNNDTYMNEPVVDFTLYGYENTAAQEYVKYNNVKSFLSPIPISEIVFDKKELSISFGNYVEIEYDDYLDDYEKTVLRVSINPEIASPSSLEWKSSDENVVTIDDGCIYSVGVGTAVVTASFGDVSESCSIVVPQTEVYFTVTEINLKEGDKAVVLVSDPYNPTDMVKEPDVQYFYLYFAPNDVKNRQITWSFDSETVVTVNNGTIVAKSDGEATVTALSSYGSKATCRIIVEKTTVNFDQQSVTVHDDDKLKIELHEPVPSGYDVLYERYPDTIYLAMYVSVINKEITWSVSDEDVIAVIDDNIVIKKAGTAILTAQLDNGESASCEIIVLPTFTPGDINNDEAIDIADALMVARYDAGLVEMDETQVQAGNVNGDEATDIGDALMIARYDAGLITEFT